MELNKLVQERANQQALKCDVLGSGPTTATIAIVAEAPGAAEAKSKKPLIGESGRLLFNILKGDRYGNITRQQVYCTNVYKRQLLFKSGKAVVSDAEDQYWRQLLLFELSQMPNLQYVLCMGNPALQALCGETGVTKWRGSVIDATLLNRAIKAQTGSMGQVRAIVTNNAAAVVREPALETLFRMDVAKLSKVINGNFPAYEINHRIRPSFNEAMDWIDKMQDEKKPVSLDIETMALETAVIGLANDPHDGMCINLRDETTNVYSIEEERKLHERLQVFANAADTRIVAQYGNFDCYWLLHKNALRFRTWFDTLLAHHTLYPQLPHGLGFLVSQYTTHPYYKDDLQAFKEGGDLDTYLRYNVKDVCLTLACYEKLHKELNEQKQADFFFNHVMRLAPHLVEMTVGGVKVDTTLKTHLIEVVGNEVEQKRLAIQEAVSELFPDEPSYKPNVNSPQQLGELLFKRLKLVGKGQSTDAANRARIIDNPKTGPKAKELINRINQYKVDHKYFSTYVNSEIDEDGRMRCEYKQFGTQSAPGRLSSSGVLWGTGSNLQNQPEKAHEMFTADPGYCFVYFDLAQAEARVVGWLARIEKWKHDFERARLEGGYDCHRALAADMFGIEYDEVPVDDRDGDGQPTMRFIAKRCRHGLNYRMQYPKLAEVTGLNIIRAHTVFGLYHRITPELEVWWREEADAVRRDRKLISPKGRRWIVLGRIEDANLDSIIAFKPQSTIGDHVCEVIYRSHEDEEWPSDARIALNIHDALIALVPIDERKIHDAITVMRRHAERPIWIHGEPLIIPADFKISVPDEGNVHRWSTLAKLSGSTIQKSLASYVHTVNTATVGEQ